MGSKRRCVPKNWNMILQKCGGYQRPLELFQNSFVLVRGDSLKHVYDNWAKNYFKYQPHCQYHQYQYQYKCPFSIVIPIFLNHLSFQPRPLCKVEKVDPALLLSRLSKLLRHTPFKNRHSIVQPLQYHQIPSLQASERHDTITEYLTFRSRVYEKHAPWIDSCIILPSPGWWWLCRSFSLHRSSHPSPRLPSRIGAHVPELPKPGGKQLCQKTKNLPLQISFEQLFVKTHIYQWTALMLQFPQKSVEPVDQVDMSISIMTLLVKGTFRFLCGFLILFVKGRPSDPIPRDWKTPKLGPCHSPAPPVLLSSTSEIWHTFDVVLYTIIQISQNDKLKGQFLLSRHTPAKLQNFSLS